MAWFDFIKIVKEMMAETFQADVYYILFFLYVNGTKSAFILIKNNLRTKIVFTSHLSIETCQFKWNRFTSFPHLWFSCI